MPGGTMLTTTLTKQLEQYGIAEKLRGLRLKKKMGLVELGKHTGLSPAMLSKVERGKLFPTLPTLVRIAMVFGVGLEYFFSDDRQRHVLGIVRRAERKRFPERADGKDNSFFFESLDFAAVERKLNAYSAEFCSIARGKPKPHHHAGVEFLTVVRGKLEMHIGPQEHTLERGDSIYFDSSIPHTYRRASGAPCSAIVVTVP
jgi:transcriptional regulator with XRE-family HTH domain